MTRASLQPIWLFAILTAPITLSAPITAQNPDHPTQSQPGVSHAPPGLSSYTLKTYTRLVNIEVVVKDSKHNHIQGLKPDDFEIEEQTPDKSKNWSPQRIANLREVHMDGISTPASLQFQLPKGVYTNAAIVPKDPVPVTILLVDGLNTDVKDQAQIHVQMLKMMRQLPPNVPMAVFLLGDRLRMLQSFTQDPKLLQEALSKAMSTAGTGVARMDPRDDPDSPGNLAAAAKAGGSNGAETVAAISDFDERVFMATMDERVLRTINALTSLGHNVAGYPGRKNLLWLSTSFPINLASVLATGATSDLWTEARDYWPQLRRLNAVLSDAKVAVYPVSLAGVQTLQAYQAGARPPNTSSGGFSGNITRDTLMQNASVDTMHEIAEGTGGIVCTGDNDLGDCVRKAVDDSSDFYEMSYYSDSTDWNGEFRKIAVKTRVKGAHLAYREGYYAAPEGGPDPKAQSAQLQSGCDDYLDATAIPFSAMRVSPDAQGQLNFSLIIDASALTIAPNPDGTHQLDVAVAVCTYNEKDWAQKILSYPVNIKLSAEQFQTVTSTGRLTDTVRVPAPRPAAVRVLVEDVPTGRLGSIHIKTGDEAPESGAAKQIAR